MQRDIPDVYKLDDTVYHYTSFDTAVRILESRKLRLTERKISRDPIENNKPFVSFSSRGNEDRESESRMVLEQKKANDYIKAKYANAKQVSFCMSDFSINKHIMGPCDLECYGFLKPRMWEQYGNLYKGVCLAFSLNKLRQNHSSKMLGRKIKYQTYRNLQSNFHSIDKAQLSSDSSLFYSNIDNRIVDYLCCKHVDYKGECEYRILSFSEELEEDYLGIEDCLVGIVASRCSYQRIFQDGHEDEARITDLKQFGVDILNVRWDSYGVSIFSQDLEDKRREKIRERFETLRINKE